MPITQQRFLDICGAAERILERNRQIRRSLHNGDELAEEAELCASANDRIAPDAARVIRLLSIVLRTSYKLASEADDNYDDLVTLIVREREHFRMRGAYNDRTASRRRQQRETVAKINAETYIPQFFDDPTPALALRANNEISDKTWAILETMASKLALAELAPKNQDEAERLVEALRTHGPDKVLSYTRGDRKWEAAKVKATSLPSTGNVAVSKVEPEVKPEVEPTHVTVSEVEPSYGETVKPPPPTIAEQRGNDQALIEDIILPDFTPEQNPL